MAGVDDKAGSHSNTFSDFPGFAVGNLERGGEGRGSFKVLSSHHQSRTMGAGASTEARQTAVSMLLNKPEDASDITDVETAKSEIIALRKFAKNFQDQLRSK